MTTRVPRRSLAHPDGAEWKGDLPRAIRQAARDGKRWIDINGLVDKIGTVLGAHYPDPLRHGFYDPQHKLDDSTPLDHMHPDEWGRLLTRDGDHHIFTMEHLITVAKDEHVYVELDMKCDMTPDQLQPLVDMWHVWVKTMFTLNNDRAGKPWVRLDHGHQADAPTIALCHHPFIGVPKSYKPVIDYYRVFPPRYR